MLAASFSGANAIKDLLFQITRTAVRHTAMRRPPCLLAQLDAVDMPHWDVEPVAMAVGNCERSSQLPHLAVQQELYLAQFLRTAIGAICVTMQCSQRLF